MNCVDEIMEYKEALPKDTKYQCQIAIVKLINEGFTPEWVLAALKSKPKENWITWGFGLFFSKSFREQIDIELTAEKCNLYELWNVTPHEEDDEDNNIYNEDYLNDIEIPYTQEDFEYFARRKELDSAF